MRGWSCPDSSVGAHGVGGSDSEGRDERREGAGADAGGGGGVAEGDHRPGWCEGHRHRLGGPAATAGCEAAAEGAPAGRYFHSVSDRYPELASGSTDPSSDGTRRYTRLHDGLSRGGIHPVGG